MTAYRKAFKTAFPYTVPVMTGYIFIGIAFGIMFQEKGYNVLWAALMSTVVYAGSIQYLSVNFFAPGFSLVQVAFMTLMVNIRHIFYGLTFLEKFHKMGNKKWYMIFALTDETYSLLYGTNIPQHVDEDQFLFAITMLNQCHWVTGSALGAVIGSLIPFDMEGIDFALTALYVVMLTEQWLNARNRLPVIAGVICAVGGVLLFGRDSFILPSMLVITGILLCVRKKLESEECQDAS